MQVNSSTVPVILTTLEEPSVTLNPQILFPAHLYRGVDAYKCVKRSSLYTKCSPLCMIWHVWFYRWLLINNNSQRSWLWFLLSALAIKEDWTSWFALLASQPATIELKSSFFEVRSIMACIEEAPGSPNAVCCAWSGTCGSIVGCWLTTAANEFDSFLLLHWP